MKGRANSSKTFSNFVNSHSPCDKHPFSSSAVGICPHCLNDQLLKLVCPDCGERRATACSCSRNRNSCSNADVGRISFLIDSDKIRRSSSYRAGVKKSAGFSRIKGLFAKRKRNGNDEDSEDGFGLKPNQMELDRFCVFPIKERELSETGFIELKQEFFSAGRSSIASDHARNEEFEILASLRTAGNSCRITMNERGIKQGSRSSKLWKWIFKNRNDN